MDEKLLCHRIHEKIKCSSEMRVKYTNTCSIDEMKMISTRAKANRIFITNTVKSRENCYIGNVMEIIGKCERDAVKSGNSVAHFYNDEIFLTNSFNDL